MNLKRCILSIVVLEIFCLFEVRNVESALPFGVFPLLTSGWYYKPNPVESVIFGLIVVKILAIRLASVTGVLPIPYHLNDLFARSLGKRSVSQKQQQQRAHFLQAANLTMPRTGAVQNTSALSSTELTAMYRLLLGVRRLDTSDCFLKTLCFLGNEGTNSTNISYEEQQLISTINYLTSLEGTSRKDELSKPPVMDVFHEAIQFGMKSKAQNACNSRYSMCPLSETEMNYESILFDAP